MASALIGVSCAIAWSSEGGAWLLTTEGKRIEAPVTCLGNGQFRVGETTLGLDAIAQVHLREIKPATEFILPPDPPVGSTAGGLPEGWSSVDIGRARQPGSATYTVENANDTNRAGIFQFKTVSLGLYGRADSCQFVHRSMAGDGQLIAQVLSASPTERSAISGIMIRASLDPGAPRVAMGITTGDGGLFHYRERPGIDSRIKKLREGKAPGWVKIERRGKVFHGFYSADGKNWELLESVTLPVSGEVRAGLFAASHRENLANTSRVAHVHVLTQLSRNNETRVLLYEGSTLAGELENSVAPRFVISRNQQKFSLTTNQVARLLFRALPEAAEERLRYARSGYFTRRGDYQEAVWQGIEQGLLKFRVRQNLQSLMPGVEVAAVFLKDFLVGSARFEVRTIRGDIFYVSQIQWQGKNARIEIPEVGEIVIPADELAHVRQLGALGGTQPAANDAGKTASASRVETRAGKVIAGQLRFTSDGVALKLGGTTEQTLRWNDILNFSREPGQEQTGSELARLSPDWQANDMGHLFIRGTHQWSGSNLVMLSGGNDFHRNRDSLYYMWKSLEGNGEVTVCLRDLQGANDTDRAGVMIRERLDSGARTWFAGQTLKRGLGLFRRSSPVGSLDNGATRESTAPVWLKIERDGRNLNAFFSHDGKKWSELGSDSLEMTTRIYVGIAVTSQSPQTMARAVFTDLSAASFSAVTFKPRLQLVSGTEIPGTIIAADDTLIKFAPEDGLERTIPQSAVARLVFQPLTGELASSLVPGRAGVLLRNGDFMEAEFRSLEKDQIKVSSTIFGLRIFKIADEAMALVLRDVVTVPNAAQFRLADDSCYRTKDYQFQDGQLLVRESSLGEVKIPMKNLRGFQRGQ
jgi:regulation of enolase protein 1 (concanavalin A-like superfamily)